jgi:L-cysteine/cystine lyase
MATDPRLAAIREELPALAGQVYLNTGTAGPLPRRTHEAIVRAAEGQFLNGRAAFKVYMEEYFPLREELRGRWARLLGAHPDEIALTHHTTEGMNVAVWGLPWQTGDEIVIATHEHEGGLLPVYAAARRFGLRLRMVEAIGTDGDLAAVTAALTTRTRLVVISHVTFTTGAILPLREIAEAAHRVGALVAVDGAQAVGALPVNVHELGVDFYSAPGQKWLCGPEGLGALYVRRDRLTDLMPTFVGFFSIAGPEAMDLTGHFLPAPGATRYEQGTVYWPALYGLNESLRWLDETVGWPWIFERTAAMTAQARALLADLPGVTIHSPATHNALTAFSLAGLEPQPTFEHLAAMGITLRPIPHYNWLRIATGVFTSDDDLARLAEGLGTLLQTGTGAG